MFDIRGLTRQLGRVHDQLLHDCSRHRSHHDGATHENTESVDRVACLATGDVQEEQDGGRDKQDHQQPVGPDLHVHINVVRAGEDAPSGGQQTVNLESVIHCDQQQEHAA